MTDEQKLALIERLQSGLNREQAVFITWAVDMALQNPELRKHIGEYGIGHIQDAYRVYNTRNVR